MSTRTSKLSLISNNTDSDPFLRSDFVNNWATLDASPGLYICTSKTRPTWGAPQKGRGIVETDTWRQLTWTGTKWQEPLVAPGAWGFESAPSQNLGPNSNVNWTMGTINATRACLLTTMTTVQASVYPIVSPIGHWGNFYPTVDGKVSTMTSAHTGHVQWRRFDSKSSTGDWQSVTFFGMTTIDPGKHILGIRASMSGNNKSPVIAEYLSTVALVTAPNGGNTNVS